MKLTFTCKKIFLNKIEIGMSQKDKCNCRFGQFKSNEEHGNTHEDHMSWPPVEQLLRKLASDESKCTYLFSTRLTKYLYSIRDLEKKFDLISWQKTKNWLEINWQTH